MLQNTIESNQTSKNTNEGQMQRIRTDVINGIKQRFNEEALNDNEKAMIALFTQKKLRINNTYFEHKTKQNKVG